MARGLTEKQQNILNFIISYVDDKGYPPSIREIGVEFQISSLRGVTVHLDALQRKGKITRLSTSRSITVIGHTGASAHRKDFFFVPLVGTIAAGLPIAATQNIEMQIPVPQEMIRGVKKAFALRVKGDSMINAHIMEGDLVVVKEQNNADDGDIVAVLLGDEATVKYIKFTLDGVKLVAANPAYQPIDVKQENSKIMGKVIGLIRNYDMPIRF